MQVLNEMYMCVCLRERESICEWYSNENNSMKLICARWSVVDYKGSGITNWTQWSHSKAKWESLSTIHSAPCSKHNIIRYIGIHYAQQQQQKICVHKPLTNQKLLDGITHPFLTHHRSSIFSDKSKIDWTFCCFSSSSQKENRERKEGNRIEEVFRQVKE